MRLLILLLLFSNVLWAQLPMPRETKVYDISGELEGEMAVIIFDYGRLEISKQSLGDFFGHWAKRNQKRDSINSKMFEEIATFIQGNKRLKYDLTPESVEERLRKNVAVADGYHLKDQVNHLLEWCLAPIIIHSLPDINLYNQAGERQSSFIVEPTESEIKIICEGVTILRLEVQKPE